MGKNEYENQTCVLYIQRIKFYQVYFINNVTYEGIVRADYFHRQGPLLWCCSLPDIQLTAMTVVTNIHI